MVFLGSLAIRGVHLLSMAILFGGAVLTWAIVWSGHDARLLAATTYEWLFWAGAGLIVMTGVGNLGALAPALPGLGTTWGAAFGVKLVAVFGLLLGSGIRTIAVVRWAGFDPASPSVERRCQLAYALTAGYLLVIVALGEVLAHG